MVDVVPKHRTTVLLSHARAASGSTPDFTDRIERSLWLNYSSIVANETKTRKVTVQISEGTVPSGVELKVSAAEAIGGVGSVGSSVGEVTLTNSPKDLVMGIGSCYTGEGAARGHKLTYAFTFQPADFNKVLFTSSIPITVTYTITN